jgi:D-alanyl-lipoteichoic acid acyltransferase DltB (MBOAT superfamily)
MDSASFQFAGFGLAVAILSNFSRKAAWRSGVLFVASLAFLYLLAPQPLTLLPLAGFLAIGYLGIFLLERGVARSYTFSLLVIIFAYIWLKKYTILPAALFLKAPYFTVGLSYIFFRVLHLLIDTADRPGDRRLGPGAYLLYTLNFTTLVSGPIQRYEDFACAQFSEEPAPLDVRVVGLQIERLVRGFFKVNVLAMLFNALQQDALVQISQPLPTAFKMWAAFRIAVLYPIFLYCNFSGYIDIVIALARLMRLPLPENFDRPFAAASVLDFWNRWHMTLSNWLKTYVYNPLFIALMRRIPSPALEPYLGVFCFFVTFFLIGVWHGRTSEFIFFGVLTGGGMAMNKIWQLSLARAMGRKGYRDLAKNPLYTAFARGLNFIWFAFTLFWFWGGWKQIDTVFSALGIVEWLGVLTLAWLAATGVLALWEWLRALLLSIRTSEGPILISRYARAVYASALGLAALVITVLLNQPAPGIVYKAF